MENEETMENLYADFLRWNSAAEDPANVDFLGMNFDGTSSTIKAYFNQENSTLDDSAIVFFLRRQNMIRYYESVAETNFPGTHRMDIALAERNDRNMQLFLEELQKESDLFAANKKLIFQLSSLKITDLPAHSFSSLYFFGYRRTEKAYDILKFHFYTKWCQDPGHPGRNAVYRDREFLEELKAMDIPAFSLLLPAVDSLLTSGAGHLWMIGVDLGKTGSKYKIYVKNPQDDGALTARIVRAFTGIDVMPAFVWLHDHQEYAQAGLAICTGDTGKLSVNIYFTPETSRQDTKGRHLRR